MPRWGALFATLATVSLWHDTHVSDRLGDVYYDKSWRLSSWIWTICKIFSFAALMLCIIVDNYIKSLYFNGVSQTFPAGGNDWTRTKCLPLPAAPVQIAIEGTNAESVAGMLASVTGNIPLTNSSWKCTKTFHTNWMSTTYDDSVWPARTWSALPASHLGAYARN